MHALKRTVCFGIKDKNVIAGIDHCLQILFDWD
jgi:hypothetical protein